MTLQNTQKHIKGKKIGEEGAKALSDIINRNKLKTLSVPGTLTNTKHHKY